MEVALGHGDYLRGLEELKAKPLKEQRRHLKNDFFRVSNLTSFLNYWFECRLTLASPLECGSSFRALDDHQDVLKAMEGEVSDLRWRMEAQCYRAGDN